MGVFFVPNVHLLSTQFIYLVELVRRENGSYFSSNWAKTLSQTKTHLTLQHQKKQKARTTRKNKKKVFQGIPSWSKLVNDVNIIEESQIDVNMDNKRMYEECVNMDATAGCSESTTSSYNNTNCII